MYLPSYVNLCMDKLEHAGFATYAVGGCVRDSLLGLTPQDYDLCTNATPEQMRKVFQDHRLILAGEKHGTVGVLVEEEIVEITTFRTEGGYRDNRHPDWVRFEAHIEADLSRRDFTVNAMAYSPTRGLADPFGGQADLKNKCLRAVGDAATRFTEDALRILRGVRFAVRYGLTPEKATETAMFSLAPRMDNLARERVFSELCKLLPLVTAEDLLRFTPVLTQVLPELTPLVGFDQHSPHHAYDIFTHTAHVVAAVPGELPLRWAALLHDTGKPLSFYLDETGRGHFPDHAGKGAALADAALLRLKAPTAFRNQVTTLIKLHMTPLEPDKRLLRRRLNQLGQETLEQLLQLQEADAASKGIAADISAFSQIRLCLQELLSEDACFSQKDLAINGKDLVALGFVPGKALGACLDALLQQVLDEKLPNERAALLAAAENYPKE